MMIKSISMKNFRKFDSYTHEFTPGLNELVEDNEWGKTTITDAIRYALTEKKIQPVDRKIGSPNDPEIRLEIEDDGSVLQFDVRGFELKPKKERDRIAEHFGVDYNYLVNRLLVVKHRDIEDFSIDANFVERMMRLENISEYSSIISGLFTQKGLLSKPSASSYFRIMSSLQELDAEIRSLEEKLARSEESKKKLAEVQAEVGRLGEQVKKLESEEVLLGLLLARAELDERVSKLKSLEKRKSVAEGALTRLKVQLEKATADASDAEKRVTKLGKADLGALYGRKSKLERTATDLARSLAEIARISKEIKNIEKKIGATKPKVLSADLTRWEKALVRMDLGYKIGMRTSIGGNADVSANGKRVAPNAELEFDNRVHIAVGKTVEIDVWAGGESIARHAETAAELNKAYGSIDKLKTLVSLHENLVGLRDELDEIILGEDENDIKERHKESLAALKGVDAEIAQAEKAGSAGEKEREALLSLSTEKATLKEKVRNEDAQLKEIKAELAGLRSSDEADVNELNDKINGLPHGLVEKYSGMDAVGLRTGHNQARAGKDSAKDAIIDRHKMLRELQKDISDVSEDELERKRAEMRSLSARKKEADNYLNVLRGLGVVFPELGKTLNEQVFAAIQEKTLAYFRMITGNAFDDFLLSSHENVDAYHLKNSQGLEMDGTACLSDGTRDQFFFALRFAMILQFSGDKPKFILLDEPFAHTDQSREKRIREILDVFVNAGWQVAVFGCKG